MATLVTDEIVPVNFRGKWFEGTRLLKTREESNGEIVCRVFNGGTMSELAAGGAWKILNCRGGGGGTCPEGPENRRFRHCPVKPRRCGKA